ncbi:MAG TPA: DUF6498-containing protein [Planctomycetota bacterium]|nr:DUF6498-containing protein [Planctomycetota bacterium]
MRFRMPKDKVSLVALILANLLPLGGVIFAGWDAGTIVLLYWSENLILGFYTVLRMAFAKVGGLRRGAGRVFAIAFFCVHYGIFCQVHGFFVLMLVSMGRGGTMGEPDFGVLPGILRRAIWPFLALAVSHGVSFVQNYLVRGEYVSANVMREMGRPYGRIVLLHVVIIFAAMPTVLLGSPMPLVVLLIIGKLAADLVLHARSHRGRSTGNTVEAATEG